MFTLLFEPDGRKVKVPSGSTVFQAAKEAGVGIRSECGGKGACGKCKIIIKDSKVVNEVTEVERKYLSRLEIDSGYRLACQSRIRGNVTVIIPLESRLVTRKFQLEGLERQVELKPAVKKFHVRLPKPTLSAVRPDLERLLDALSQQVLNAGELEIDYEILRELPKILRDADWSVTVTVWDGRKVIAVEPGDTSSELFGFAVDIGTSKIVGHLVNLRTGETVGVGAIENPQIMHGEDIITRLTFAINDEAGLRTLQKLAIEGVNKLIREVCVNARVNSSNVYEVVAVGNTAMHHLLLAIQPKYVTLSPFTPAVKKKVSVATKELNIGVSRGGLLTFLPLIAGFVGADAVADVLVTGIHESDELSLLVDIGTNTEVLVGNSEDILLCSCASGPAFEGVHIKHGIKAVRGAIEKVRINSDYEVHYETIGNTKPTGLCGSAMIDVVAEMFKHRIIDNRGRFNVYLKTRRLRENNDEKEFVIAWKDETATGKEITVTQKDIDEIQLAKAAIYAGCSILMKRKNVEVKDLDRVFIAGAFGNCINLKNARLIGLIPDVPTKKVTFVGNTAISGAKMALISKEARKATNVLSKRIRYLELTIDSDFNTEFAHAMYIPHKNLSRFPSVKAML